MEHLRPFCVDVTSRAYATLMEGVGTSPLAGDVAWPQLEVPADPTLDYRRRYRFLLAAMVIPGGHDVEVLGISTWARIGWVRDIQIGQQTIQQRVDIPITDPFFAFSDGNISFHFRFLQGQTEPGLLDSTSAVVYPRGVTGAQYPVDAALQALALPPAYLPPQGDIPGLAVGSLGTFNELRFLAQVPQPSLKLHQPGMGILALFATVYQTNPATRVPLAIPQGFDLTSLTAEQRFIRAGEAAGLLVRYTQVGGRILLNLNPRPLRPAVGGPPSPSGLYPTPPPDPDR